MKIVFTDLDGTLLDHETYSWEGARAALDELQNRRVPLIFVTSKTRAEVEVWRQRLENHHPFIVENGGPWTFELVRRLFDQIQTYSHRPPG